jgi:hypothetical protein
MGGIAMPVISSHATTSECQLVKLSGLCAGKVWLSRSITQLSYLLLTSSAMSATQCSGGGICVGKMPKRFFRVTLSRENLSSGENLAGCAHLQGWPCGSSFCRQALDFVKRGFDTSSLDRR